MIRKLGLLSLGAGAALLLLPDMSRAQVNVQWVTFTKTPTKLTVPAMDLCDLTTQIQFRTADINNDGWPDVVGMRKQQASTLGKRAAYLLMNDHGVLEDKTAQWASASDVLGDMGFLTPVNARESQIVDVTGDGFLDVVTCITLSDGDPKHISHPRVYVNLGNDGGGNWLGLKYEDARIQQLKTVGNLSVAPRFCGLGAADVTGDGAADLYFVDYDGTETGIGEPANWDLNDRLLVNDGNGFFTDQSSTRFTATQLLSAFGADVETVDINGDGFVDICKDTTLNNPLKVRILYNNPANVGDFTAMGVSDLGSNAPYGMDLANLNNDGIMDVAIADDGSDRFRLGTGLDGLGKMIWGPLKTYSFVSGSDDGFGHNVYIRDLDNNGWNDVLITDVDGDLLGCDRRLHIYHNLGTVPGDMNLVLKEEAQQASGGTGAGWKGVVGMVVADLKGNYDTGFGDFDLDGDQDILLGSCTLGTTYWQNQTALPVCQADLGFAGPGTMAFSVCGEDLTQNASVASMSLTGAAASQALFIPVGLVNNPVPLKGGTLVPNPILTIVSGFNTSGTGTFSAPFPGNAGTNVHLYMQCIVKNGTVYEFSNAVDVLLGL